MNAINVDASTFIRSHPFQARLLSLRTLCWLPSLHAPADEQPRKSRSFLLRFPAEFAGEKQISPFARNDAQGDGNGVQVLIRIRR